MIRWMRSARIARGQYVKALVWAKEISEYSKKYEGISDVGVYLQSFGEVGTIWWFADYESLSAFEKIQTQILADPQWWQKMDEIKDLFIEGSVNDTVLRAI